MVNFMVCVFCHRREKKVTSLSRNLGISSITFGVWGVVFVFFPRNQRQVLITSLECPILF